MTETIPAVLTDSADDPTAARWASSRRLRGRRPRRPTARRRPRRGRRDRRRRRRPASRCSPATSTTRPPPRRASATGWFLTGDVPAATPIGRFTFDGRRSDVLKVAGENVSTVEVEQVADGASRRARGRGGRRARRRPRRGARWRSWCRRPGAAADARRAARVVRRAADQVEAAPRHHASSTSCHAPASARSASSCSRPRAERPTSDAPECTMTILTDDLLASFDASDRRRRQGGHACRRRSTRPSEFLGVRARGAVRPRVAVRRPRRAHPERRRLVHGHDQRRADHRRPRQGRPGALPCRRSASTAAMQVCDGAGQLHQVHVPVPPLELRPRPAGCSARRRWSAPRRSTRRTTRCPQLRVEQWQGFVFVNFDPDAAPLAPDARRATSRTSPTTTSTTPCARARSRSTTCRGTGR